MYTEKDLEEAFLEGYMSEKTAYDKDDLLYAYNLGHQEALKTTKQASIETPINLSKEKAASIISQIYSDYRNENLKQVVHEWEAMIAQNNS